MEVINSIGKLPERVTDYFDFDKLDAYHSAEVNTVINGNYWECVLITEDRDAFFHVYNKNLIKKTEYFDIEPLFGYAGPITNSTNQNFINEALKIYWEHCRSKKIVAELFRFNPILQNHTFFESTNIETIPSKEIVIVNCYPDSDIQLAEFNRLGKRYIKNIIDETEILFSESHPLKDFQRNYELSLKKHNAGKSWYLDDSFFKRAEFSNHFVLVQVKYRGELKIQSLIIKSNLAFYHFITSILEPRIKGLNDFLILTLSLTAARNNSKYLILGGGNTALSNDPLLLYKKNFNKTGTTFYIGKGIYIPEIYNSLCSDYLTLHPEYINSTHFLKYRM